MGRVAVVTGAVSGMGLAVARRLAERGDRVALGGVGREPGSDRLASIGSAAPTPDASALRASLRIGRLP